MIRIAIASTVLGGALAGCGDNLDVGSAASGRWHAVVVAGDFKPDDQGVLSTLDVPNLQVAANAGPALAIGGDPMLRHIEHELFVVNGLFGNRVTVLDDQTLALVEQLGTGDGSIPEDVAVVGDKLYVPTYGTVGLTVVTRGSRRTAIIDLSADDPDHRPDCTSAFRVGTDVYVACQLLNEGDESLLPRGPGKVYVIDAATDTVRTSLTLGHRYPIGRLEQVPAGAPHAGELVIGTAYLIQNDIGCVERIVPGDVPSAPGCLVDNADLGGSANRIAFRVDGTGTTALFSVPGPFSITNPTGAIRSLDLAGTEVLALSSAGEAIRDIAVCPSGEIVAADIAPNGNGLRVFAGGSELTTAPLAVGMRPDSTHGLACY
jgi:hypothetical protein